MYALFTPSTFYAVTVRSPRFNRSALLAHHVTLQEAGPDVSLIFSHQLTMKKAEHVAAFKSSTGRRKVLRHMQLFDTSSDSIILKMALSSYMAHTTTVAQALTSHCLVVSAVPEHAITLRTVILWLLGSSLSLHPLPRGQLSTCQLHF